MQPTSYAQRLLNPFRGVMNIIEYQGAEAVTTDGLHWDIYVRDKSLVEDLANSHRVQTSDIRYGSWSPSQGLKRGALYPSDDFKQLEMLGAVVYEYLLEHYTEVPFTLRDHFELWLLDGNDRPLALLDSALSEAAIALDCAIDWRAGHECRKTFTTPLLDQLDRGNGDINAGAFLTDLVNGMTGPTPRAQWFRRSDDRCGHGLDGIGIGPELCGRTLPEQAFADLHLRIPGENALHHALLDAYLEWQAPYLLLLQHLDTTQRRHYEQCAVRRAMAIENQYRLYPEILDPEAVKAARVEALLRSSDASQDETDEAMATYYIELNVTRTN